MRYKMRDERGTVGSVAIVTEQPISVSNSEAYIIFKRVSDFVLSFPMLIIAIVIRIDSPGPVIFAEVTSGRAASAMEYPERRHELCRAEAGTCLFL